MCIYIYTCVYIYIPLAMDYRLLSWLTTPITMVYDTYNLSVHGAHKPTYNQGGAL